MKIYIKPCFFALRAEEYKHKQSKAIFKKFNEKDRQINKRKKKKKKRSVKIV